ncbi:MAG: DsrE family protein [Dehalococcoidia bacterium]|nr:DsrE family protein [Dehalococcoidia bacterium]
MAEEIEQQPNTDEECAECVVDVAALKARRQEQGERENTWSALIMLTRGTYGHWDDAFSAIQVGNAVLAVEEGATMLLLADGVYFAVKGQDPSGIGLANNTNYIQDFLDLGGRMLVLGTSLEKRGLSREDLLEGVDVITTAHMVAQVASHNVSVTF